MKSPQKLTIATAIILILAILGVIIYVKLPKGNNNNSIDINYSQQPVLGDRNAPVKVVLLEDFLCPHCASFTDGAFLQLKREYADNNKVAFFFINFPLGSFGPPSTISAQAVECVYAQDNNAFWEFKTLLMRSQRKVDYTAQGLAKLANDYIPNLDSAELEICIEENKYGAEVTNDRTLAQKVATSTPTVLVNGEVAVNATGDSDPSYFTIKTTIENALANLTENLSTSDSEEKEVDSVNSEMTEELEEPEESESDTKNDPENETEDSTNNTLEENPEETELHKTKPEETEEAETEEAGTVDNLPEDNLEETIKSVEEDTLQSPSEEAENDQ